VSGFRETREGQLSQKRYFLHRAQAFIKARTLGLAPLENLHKTGKIAWSAHAITFPPFQTFCLSGFSGVLPRPSHVFR